MTNYDIVMDLAERRAIELTRKHGVAQKNTMGAYHGAPRRHVEYLFHEVAHWITFGQDPKKVPRRLSNFVQESFRRMSPIPADSLEIDASMVTYLAGWALGYWTDPGPIVNSCRRNLSGIASLAGTDNDIYKEFERRWENHRTKYVELAISLARWFRPSVQLQAFPESKFP